MDGNNRKAAQGNAPAAGAMHTADWRTQLQPDSRQRIVNKIMENIKGRLPVSGQEGAQELNKIAMRFEDMIHTAATSK
uniref:Mediator of RNA polymerase II transcription subunit 15a-like n=1 Tax=Nicotiana sylvestris TaxID=4096 RepID=A0A1U7XP39_NICSY